MDWLFWLRNSIVETGAWNIKTWVLSLEQMTVHTEYILTSYCMSIIFYSSFHYFTYVIMSSQRAFITHQFHDPFCFTQNVMICWMKLLRIYSMLTPTVPQIEILSTLKHPHKMFFLLIMMSEFTNTYLVFIKFEYKFKNLSKLFDQGLLCFKMLGRCHWSRA